VAQTLLSQTYAGLHYLVRSVATLAAEEIFYMNLNKLVLLGAMSICTTTAWSVANATSYASEGKSFSAVATGLNTEATHNGTFEVFTRDNKNIANVQAVNAATEAQPETTSASDTDTWLMLLISSGLVALQLRRKQKSLPHQTLSTLTAE